MLTMTQAKSSNHVPGTLLSEWISNNLLRYIFYYYLHFLNEKTERPKAVTWFTQSQMTRKGYHDEYIHLFLFYYDKELCARGVILKIQIFKRHKHLLETFLKTWEIVITIIIVAEKFSCISNFVNLNKVSDFKLKNKLSTQRNSDVDHSQRNLWKPWPLFSFGHIFSPISKAAVKRKWGKGFRGSHET